MFGFFFNSLIVGIWRNLISTECKSGKKLFFLYRFHDCKISMSQLCNIIIKFEKFSFLEICLFIFIYSVFVSLKLVSNLVIPQLHFKRNISFPKLYYNTMFLFDFFLSCINNYNTELSHIISSETPKVTLCSNFSFSFAVVYTIS